MCLTLGHCDLSMTTLSHAVMFLDGRPSRKKRLTLKGFAALDVVFHLTYFHEHNGEFSADECACMSEKL